MADFRTQIIRMCNQNGGVKTLAKRLGVAPATIYYWRRGEHLPSGKSLAAIQNLGIDVTNLLTASSAAGNEKLWNAGQKSGQQNGAPRSRTQHQNQEDDD